MHSIGCALHRLVDIYDLMPSLRTRSLMSRSLGNGLLSHGSLCLRYVMALLDSRCLCGPVERRASVSIELHTHHRTPDLNAGAAVFLGRRGSSMAMSLEGSWNYLQSGELQRRQGWSLRTLPNSNFGGPGGEEGTDTSFDPSAENA